MGKDNSRAVVETLNDIIQKLSRLEDVERRRIMNSVATFFDDDSSPSKVHSGKMESIETSSADTQPRPTRPLFSEDRVPTAKDFLFAKQPKTDVERIACLAFYLTHFRDMPFFKTLDLGKLNTEAAQVKFSNTAYATDNATKAGYLAPASRGLKQITAWGEQFVAALPDREAAMKIVEQVRKRQRRRQK
jgi:restriction endonuclease Mrr